MAKKSTVKNNQFFNEETGTYANQLVTILVRVKEDQIRESRGAAYQDLSPAAFGLYIFASMDADYFPRVWSWNSVAEWCDMSYSTYRRAIGELVKKEYIKDGHFYLGAALEKQAPSLKNESSPEPKPLKNERKKKEKALKNESPMTVFDF